MVAVCDRTNQSQPGLSGLCLNLILNFELEVLKISIQSQEYNLRKLDSQEMAEDSVEHVF